MEWVQQLHKLYPQLFILVDIAAYVPSTPISFSENGFYPDFCVLSFYKIFGYPTGVGALLINNNVIDKIDKSYWGGGSVLSVLMGEDFKMYNLFFINIFYYSHPKNPSQKYEDGTPDFLSIIYYYYYYI